MKFSQSFSILLNKVKRRENAKFLSETLIDCEAPHMLLSETPLFSVTRDTLTLNPYMKYYCMWLCTHNAPFRDFIQSYDLLGSGSSLLITRRPPKLCSMKISAKSVYKHIYVPCIITWSSLKCSREREALEKQ